MVAAHVTWFCLILRTLIYAIMGLDILVPDDLDLLIIGPLFEDLLLWVFAALAEEVLRLIPVVLVINHVFRSPENIRRASIFRVCVITAVLFGAAHVINGIPLWFAVLNQGMGGLIFNIAFLKAGGLHDRHARGLFVSTTVHFLCNMTLLFMLVLFGPPA